jgi:peroxin-5
MLPREQGVDNHERLVNYFLEAIRKDAENPQLNSDLQMGLGLLFYNVSEFNKTVDCFTAALATKVDDYILWNRLGATLSNSGKSK